MESEKIFKRDSGAQYRVRMIVSIGGMSNNLFSIYVHTREKGKRAWRELKNSMTEWDIISLSLKDRDIQRRKNILEYITIKEIDELKKELISEFDKFIMQS